ncbi:heme-dependent catalase, partial [Mollisia scopiformis]
TGELGVPVNTTVSLKIGPRGPVLLEDTIGRKKVLHFAKERQAERVVHAVGHGAYGTFVSNGDYSNLTSACWLQAGASSDTFARFSTVVSPAGGGDVDRDIRGFATKLYTQCGNHDLLGLHLPSFLVNDGLLFPDVVHALKQEPDSGFPSFGAAHTTAYDFFTQRTESAFQVMNVLSDLGIPRTSRHHGSAGVSTYRFINAEGATTLFKWYFIPKLGYRSNVADEMSKIAGKMPQFQRADLYNNIEAGRFPEYDLKVQLFPDNDAFMYKNYDLLDPTIVVPFEENPPITLGTMTLNRNPTNYFAETEQVAFSPANVVTGISFVPDPVISWRLLAYDETHHYRHGSENFVEMGVNSPIVPVNNNFRDGLMQMYIYEGNSASTPNGIGGVYEASGPTAYGYGNQNFNGRIGRYEFNNDPYMQAAIFFNSQDNYSQQHTVDGYRFEVGLVADQNVKINFVNKVLNSIDNCLARRVAYGLGIPLPAAQEGTANVSGVMYPSQYPLQYTTPQPVVGLSVGIVTDSAGPSTSDLAAIQQVFDGQQLLFDIIAPHQGPLTRGVSATQSYITSSSVFFDAVIIVGNNTSLPDLQAFIQEAYTHGKPIGALGGTSS